MNAPAATAEYANACILCSRNCGITITTEQGKISKVKGDKAHPTTQGYICQKAARLPYYQDHGDRLQTPLRRLPNGEFEAISWDTALAEIAQKLQHIKSQYGGHSFAFVGGGGQGNHLGGIYSSQLRAFMKTPFIYSALAQEKTQDFWVNGRLFGHQTCHTTEDVEHADYVLFIGCNPFQSHGIPNARDTLKEIKKDPNRTMVVVDPRKSETANMADHHLQIKPGTDAFLMAAMLGIIVQENLHNEAFLTEHCTGFDQLKPILEQVPIGEYARKTDIPLATIETIARGFATAKRGCVRIDLGIQQTLNTTLNAYLEKLLYLVTGHFGKKGTNNLHAFLIPLLGNSDERLEAKGKKIHRTARHKMMPISGMYPPNILADEILHTGDDRLRAVWVDSANPLVTYADTAKLEKAFSTLELSVVVDVAMTETARQADYVLPAASQFEKCEAAGFNLEFPTNFFHLRHPTLQPKGDSLPEPEIYSRLLETLGALPKSFPLLSWVAKNEPKGLNHKLFLAALMLVFKRNKSLMKYAPSIFYRTLGQRLPKGIAQAAVLLPICLQFCNYHPVAVARTGVRGKGNNLGVNLFKRIINSPSGTLLSQHTYDEVWQLIRNPDKRIYLAIDEILTALSELPTQLQGDATQTSSELPFILMAGERRAYNANQIYRDPNWRKIDKEGALKIHPTDAESLGLSKDDQVICENDHGSIVVSILLDEGIRPGVVSLPHDYGMKYQGSAPMGPELNRLTKSDHCDPFTKTPYHKYVPVNLRKVEGAPMH